MNKGDVLATARVAGIQAAKQAAELLPMCHPVLVGNVDINFSIGDTHVEVEASVDTVDRTGVEMEALMAVHRRRAHHLRHVQVARSDDDDRAGRAVGEVRRALRALAATIRGELSFLG